MLPVPNFFDEHEADVVRTLHGSGRANLALCPLAPDLMAAGLRLAATGWLDLWPGELVATFNVLGCRMLPEPLTLDDEPSRWVTRAESAEIRAKPAKPHKHEVTATDLAAAAKQDREDRKSWHGLGNLCDGFLSATPVGASVRNDGGMLPPLYLDGTNEVWEGPDRHNLAKRLDRPCAICALRELRPMAYCVKCDKTYKKEAAKAANRRSA